MLGHCSFYIINSYLFQKCQRRNIHLIESVKNRIIKFKRKCRACVQDGAKPQPKREYDSAGFLFITKFLCGFMTGHPTTRVIFVYAIKSNRLKKIISNSLWTANFLTSIILFSDVRVNCSYVWTKTANYSHE